MLVLSSLFAVATFGFGFGCWALPLLAFVLVVRCSWCFVANVSCVCFLFRSYCCLVSFMLWLALERVWLVSVAAWFLLILHADD